MSKHSRVSNPSLFLRFRVVKGDFWWECGMFFWIGAFYSWVLVEVPYLKLASSHVLRRVVLFWTLRVTAVAGTEFTGSRGSVSESSLKYWGSWLNVCYCCVPWGCGMARCCGLRVVCLISAPC